MTCFYISAGRRPTAASFTIIVCSKLGREVSYAVPNCVLNISPILKLNSGLAARQPLSCSDAKTGERKLLIIIEEPYAECSQVQRSVGHHKNGEYYTTFRLCVE